MLGPNRIGSTILTFRVTKVIGQVTIRFPIGHFPFASSDRFSVRRTV